jgi:hypothetical protein
MSSETKVRLLLFHSFSPPSKMDGLDMIMDMFLVCLVWKGRVEHDYIIPVTRYDYMMVQGPDSPTKQILSLIPTHGPLSILLESELSLPPHTINNASLPK